MKSETGRLAFRDDQPTTYTYHTPDYSLHEVRVLVRNARDPIRFEQMLPESTLRMVRFC